MHDYEPTLPESFGASMPQPSLPGYYGVELSTAAGETLRRVADAMIPEGDGYPPAGAIVLAFTSARISPQELEILEPALASLAQHASADDLERALRQLEARRSVEFELLRAFVYYGYYASPLVHQTLRDRGFDYHGAPQPLGYEIERNPPVPTRPRGTYTPTEEVRRVSL